MAAGRGVWGWWNNLLPSKDCIFGLKVPTPTPGWEMSCGSSGNPSPYQALKSDCLRLSAITRDGLRSSPAACRFTCSLSFTSREVPPSSWKHGPILQRRTLSIYGAKELAKAPG